MRLYVKEEEKQGSKVDALAFGLKEWMDYSTIHWNTQ